MQVVQILQVQILMESNNKQTFKQVYKSSIKASYFNTMKDKYPQKSKIYIQAIEEEEQKVDENTFRLLKNYAPPQNKFQIYIKTGLVHITPDSFFSCISNRQKFQLSIRNTQLKLMNKQKMQLYLDFNLVGCQIQSSGKHFTIFVQGLNKKQFYFEPIDKSASEWADLLNKVIKQSDGAKNGFSYLVDHVPDFEKTQAISNQQFQICANSGDIILFKSEHSAARIQRVFTNSEYDHVGIILRNAKNQIFVFESTSTEGVGLTAWSQMLKYEWYKSTEKIVWRRLNLKHDTKTIAVIQAFVAKTLGKGFEISLGKLFQFSSTLKRSSEDQESKTYFCSELCARLYKELGLIDQNKSSSMYYPVDFSEKGKLNFIKNERNVYLDNEKIISFDRAK